GRDGWEEHGRASAGEPAHRSGTGRGGVSESPGGAAPGGLRPHVRPPAPRCATARRGCGGRDQSGPKAPGQGRRLVPAIPEVDDRCGQDRQESLGVLRGPGGSGPAGLSDMQYARTVAGDPLEKEPAVAKIKVANPVVELDGD